MEIVGALALQSIMVGLFRGIGSWQNFNGYGWDDAVLDMR
jgi:hypothetical protein